MILRNSLCCFLVVRFFTINAMQKQNLNQKQIISKKELEQQLNSANLEN
jgi:hypothetical protein